MRYRGGGVGHTATRQCNNILLADDDEVDNPGPDIADLQTLDDTEILDATALAAL